MNKFEKSVSQLWFGKTESETCKMKRCIHGRIKSQSADDVGKCSIYVYFVETITNKVINKSNIRHRIYNLQALGQS